LTDVYLYPGATNANDVLDYPAGYIIASTINITDAISLGDIPYAWEMHKLADSISLSDASKANKGVNITDSSSLSDAILANKGLNITDSVGLSEVVSATLTQMITDAISLGDAVAVNKLVELLDSIISLDMALISKPVNLTDSIALSESVLTSKILQLLDSIGLTDSELVKKILHISDSVSLSELLLVPLKTVKLTDNVSLTDLRFVTKPVNLTDAINLSDITVRNKFLPIVDSISLSDQPKLAYIIKGVTRDQNGNPVSSVTLWLFRSSDKLFFFQTTSDANGNYVFEAPNTTTQFFIVAFKAGTTNEVGSTYQDITGQLNQGNVGNIQVLNNGLAIGYLYGQKFSQPSAGTLKSISFYSIVGASGNARVALYSDAGNTPGSRLTSVYTVTGVAAGAWNTVTMNSGDQISLAASTNYWIVFDFSVNGGVGYSSSGGNRAYLSSWTYGNTFPNPWSGGSYDTGCEAEVYWSY
jgi:hypothetical protein